MFQTTIIGNLGRDPEMSYLPSGDPVTRFSVAVSERYTTKAGEKVENTAWVRVSVFGKAAENCNNFLTKGKKVAVVGKLQFDPATGGPKTFAAKDGSTKASFELRADTVEFLSPKGEAGESPEGGAAPGADEDIPF